VNQNGISGVYNTGTGILALTGTSSVANYQTALRSIKFSSSNSSPSASKTVAFKVNDGDVDSNSATKNLSITATNGPPDVTATPADLSYTENDPATAVDSGLNVTEPEGDAISSASASITSNYQSGQDALTWSDNNGSDSIVLNGGSSDAQTIALTGSDSAANYQAALRAVKYANSSETPSTLTRTVTFSATDALSATGSDTRGVAVTAADDPPVAVNDNGTVQEDASATSVPVLTNDTDIDGGPKTISSAGDPANGTVVLTGGSPGAHTGLTYQPDPNYCNDAPLAPADTFTYMLNGGSSATVSMTVTCVNDNPVADDESFNGANSAIGNTTFVGNDADDGAPATPDPTDTSPVSDRPHKTISGDILAGDTDVDGPGPLTVTPGTFATNDGGSVTIQADGDFTFEPKASTSCSDTSDFFDYTVEDSGSPEQTDVGRVTIAITGCAWYVNNNDAQGNDGTSEKPFDTLAQAETASAANHSIFVYDGDNTNSGYDAGVDLKSGQKLIGEAAALIVSGDNLHAADAANRPSLTDNNADVVALDDNNEVRGLQLDPQGTGGGIAGASGDTGGGTIDDVRIIDTGTAGTNPGLELDSTTGTFNVSDLTVDNSAASGTTSASKGVLLNGAGTVNFASAGTISITTAGAAGLDADSTNMGAGSVFDDITVTGSGSGGVRLFNTTGTTTLGNGSGTDLSLTTTSGGTAALLLSSAGTVNVPGAGTANISATGGPAVDTSGTPGVSLDVDTVSSSGSATTGISLAGLGTGTFSATGGSIGGATGTAFNLNGGSGNITYPGTLNNGAGQTASIINRTGGAVSLSGAINDTSDVGGGIALSTNSGGSTTFSNGAKTINTTTSGSPAQNNAITMLSSDGHTLNLTGGGLDVDSIGRGLQADTSGTLNVTGSGNTINSVSGIALDVSNTDIGASDLTFDRIDAGNSTAAADPTNGIILNTTGALGELTVTGTGAVACDSGSTAGCTGGTIQNTTGADNSTATPSGTGIMLNSTKAPSFTRMYIHDHPNYGIHGKNVTGFTLANGVINGTNGTNAAIPYHDSSARFEELTGTVSVTNSDISGGFQSNLTVDNTAAGTIDATVDGVDFGALNGANGDDSVRFEGTLNTPTAVNVTVNNSTFNDAKGDIIQYAGDGGGGGDFTFTNNTITNPRVNNAAPNGIATGGGGIVVTGGAEGTGNVVTIENNTFRDSLTNAITLIKARDGGGGTGNLGGTISGNTIGVIGTANSGSVEGDGMEITNFGHGNLNLDITGNQIHQYNSSGMQFVAGGGIAETGQMNLNISGNTISTPGTNPSVTLLQGIRMDSGVTAGDAFANCINFGANSITGASDAANKDFRLVVNQNTTIRLPGYAGGATDGAAVATFAAGKIGSGAQGTAVANSPGVFSGTGSTCP
jgi:hypothetical protein